MSRFFSFLISFLIIILFGSILTWILGAGFFTFPITILQIITKSSLLFKVFFYATPLILSGLAVALAGQAGLLNIGVEGQLYLGAFLAGLIGHGYGFFSSELWLIQILLLLIISTIIPGLVSSFAGYFKTKYSIHEVVTTLFSNFMILALLNYIINLKFVGSPYAPQTRPIAPYLELKKVFSFSKMHWGFIICLFLVVLSHFIIYKTSFGLKIRALKDNSIAFRNLGFNVNKFRMIIMFLSGVMAGLVGIQRVLGQDGCYVEGFSPGYGFIALGIAFAAQNRPYGIFIISCEFSLLQVTGIHLQDYLNVPKEFTGFLQVILILILVLFPRIITRLILRKV